MKRKRILALLFFIPGLCLLLYPAFAGLWNRRAQEQTIATYTEHVKELDRSGKDRLRKDAENYNSRIQTGACPYRLTGEQEADYSACLSVDSGGVMAYISIPSLDIRLPVYHGTSPAVLQAGAGHIPWSSLPVGGAGTHCVISGHSGLPSSELFTKIVNLGTGDVFYLETLGEKLMYRVCGTETVLPGETGTLLIRPGKDLCTLVTCVPYGVNTHRLLVHGERVSGEASAAVLYVYNDVREIPAPVIFTAWMFPAVLIPVLSILKSFLRRRIHEKKDPVRGPAGGAAPAAGRERTGVRGGGR